MSEISDSKRIAKNTMLLYVRMLVMMIVSLYTSRVILNALGVEDYGIYNVVGGVVSMFSILSGSLSAAISRFVTFELGKGNKEKLHKIFCTAINVQFLLIIVIMLLLESVGLWFLNYKMTIPPDRIVAANWVFQFSAITFVVNLWSVPYNATIIAHEKMAAFAYISLYEAFAKLLIAFVILMNPIDRLIYYGILVLCVGVTVRLIYAWYCKKHFEECTYKPVFDTILLKKMFGFAGWNFIGASSAVLRDQGGNIIINLFCGLSVNAARGIAIQVSHAVQGFVSNFMTALNPQITKSYAVGNYEYMMTLIHQGARLSYYILLIISLPIIFNAQYILMLWLGIVPDHTASFVQLVLIFAMSESLASPLVTAMLATGNIRNYQLVVGGLQMMNLPVSYLLIKMGWIPETVLIVAIVISVICEMARLYMLRSMIHLSVRSFLNKVYFNVLAVTIVAAILPYFVQQQLTENFLTFIALSCVCVISTLFSILFVGCSKKERLLVYEKIVSIRKKITRR